MASVWMETTNHPPKKIKGGMNPRAAFENASVMVKSWVAIGGGNRHAKSAPGFSYLLFEGKKLCGAIFVECMSPPSKPEKGQPLRAVKAQ